MNKIKAMTDEKMVEIMNRCHSTRTGLPHIDELLMEAKHAIGLLLAENKQLLFQAEAIELFEEICTVEKDDGDDSGCWMPGLEISELRTGDKLYVRRQQDCPHDFPSCDKPCTWGGKDCGERKEHGNE